MIKLGDAGLCMPGRLQSFASEAEPRISDLIFEISDLRFQIRHPALRIRRGGMKAVVARQGV
jgi:hypothetical protein